MSAKSEQPPHAPEQASASARRSQAIALLKAIVTVAILVLVLRKVPFHDLVARLARLRAIDLCLLVLLTTLQVTVGVVRWFRLMRRLGERPSFLSLYGDVLVGLTYNMFLPTTVGGDVVRAVRARRRAAVAHRAWSTSLFERIAGLLAMAASGAIAATVGVGSSTNIPMSIRLIAVGLSLALLVAFFGASAPFRLLVRALEKRLAGDRLSRSSITDVRGIAADLEGPLATTGARLEALAWSLLYQALGVVFVIVGARGLGAGGHELAIVIGVPIIHVLSMLPITIGGLGLREGLFVAILGRLGMDEGVALGLAAQWLASSVGFAIVGAAVALARPTAPLDGKLKADGPTTPA